MDMIDILKRGGAIFREHISRDVQEERNEKITEHEIKPED
jgi:hypothetical protein